MKTTYEQLYLLVNGYLESYKTDLTEHDKKILSEYNGKFIYGYRRTGTDLLRMLPSIDSYTWKKECSNDEAREIHILFLQSIDSNKKRGANLRVTPGGLTVRSGGLAPDGGRDVAPHVGRDIHQPSLAGRNGERPEIHTRVLGTLLPASRQMV